LGIGVLRLVIGDLSQSPIPNPQSPIPNPQSHWHIHLFQAKKLLLLYFYYLFQLLMDKKLKIKIIVLYIIIYKIDILIKLNIIDKYFIRENKYYLKYENNLNEKKNKYKIIKDNIIKKLKEKTKNVINNSNSIKIFLSSYCRFGNCIIYLNNYITICEIIGCKTILLDKDIFWFIKNNIVIKNNILIEVGNRKRFDKYLNGQIFFDNEFRISREINIIYLRNEIIRNLPKLILSNKDLYIHIRSGDLFQSKDISNEHIQPPLCFYKNILYYFKFNKNYIISSDKGNPVINKLINYCPDIIFTKNNLQYDISVLLNAYNLVSSVSSFFTASLQLNYNIKNLWEYNSNDMRFKNIVFHYDLFKYPNKNFIIYRMEPSKLYKKILYYWENNRRQNKLMIKEKCYNNFAIYFYKNNEK
jgi:hypothetical protein